MCVSKYVTAETALRKKRVLSVRILSNISMQSWIVMTRAYRAVHTKSMI